MSSPIPPSDTTPKTATFLGHSLRPLRMGELVELSIMMILIGMLFSLLPGGMSASALATAFLANCFVRAGMRFNVSGVMFLLVLSIFGLPFFRFVQAALVGG